MAKIGLGVTVAQVRGAAGGAVFSKARNGSTLRVRVKPVNPRSLMQSNVRNYMNVAAAAFKSLSAANLALWNAYAAGITRTDGVTGATYHPSAISVYTQLYAKALLYNPALAALTTPPATPYTGDTITITTTGGVGAVTFTPSAANTAGSATFVFLQKLASGNRVPNPKGFRWEGNTAFPAVAAKIINHLQSDYLHPTSVLPAGVYVPAYQFLKIATGQVVAMVVQAAVTVT